ncbi:MAG: FAD-dependent oxidoreductase [Pseudolabrys sp.]
MPALRVVGRLNRVFVSDEEGKAEHEAQDIDVNALHQGWLRKAKDAGARIVTRAPVEGGRRLGSAWAIASGDTWITAPVVVNAAGAWADRVAESFGVRTIGMTPMRRTIAVLPAPGDTHPTAGHSSPTRASDGTSSSRRQDVFSFRLPTKTRSNRTTPSSTTWCLPKAFIVSSRRSPCR